MVLGTEFARHVVLETKISPSESEKGSLQSHYFSLLCAWSSKRNCVPGCRVLSVAPDPLPWDTRPF